MPSLNENLAFKPLRIAILTISDTRDLQSDTSGQLLLERATAAGHEVVRRDIVTDDAPEISAIVSKWIEDPQIEIILTTS